jgi:hypothetical protein
MRSPLASLKHTAFCHMMSLRPFCADPVPTGCQPCSPYGLTAFAVGTLPSFAGTPFLLPHRIKGFVMSTLPTFARRPLLCHIMPWRPFLAHPDLDRFSTFYALWCHGVRPEHTPSLAGTPALPPTSLPRPFDHWAHSRMPRFLRGFSDLPHSLLGVRPRLSPRAAHDDRNPGQLGFQFVSQQ